MKVLRIARSSRIQSCRVQVICRVQVQADVLRIARKVKSSSLCWHATSSSEGASNCERRSSIQVLRELSPTSSSTEGAKNYETGEEFWFVLTCYEFE